MSAPRQLYRTRVVLALWLVAGLALPAAAIDRWLSPGPLLPPVMLVDTAGTPRRFDIMAGDRPVLLGFFFTACRRVCPVQTATMRDVRDELLRRGVAPAPLLLSVSVQPLFDTPVTAAAYAAQFGIALGDEAGWLMLTGREADLARVWSAFGETAGSPDEHTGQLWVGWPANRRWLRLDVDASVTRIADALETGL